MHPGTPKRITEIGAKNLGHRWDWNNRLLPSDAEAEEWTCHVCGLAGHYSSRCKCKIIGTGVDFLKLSITGAGRMWHKRRVVERAASKSGGNAFQTTAVAIMETPHCAFSAGHMVLDPGQLVS
jgi:hypothetical protein